MRKTKTIAAVVLAILLLALPTMLLWMLAAGFLGLRLSFLVPAIAVLLVASIGLVAHRIENKSPRKRTVLWPFLAAAVLTCCVLAENHYRHSYLPSITVQDYTGYFLYRPFTGSEHLVRLEAPSTLQFSPSDELPRIDGATALFPIYCSFVENTYPKGCDTESLVGFSTTEGAYENLIKGECDIIFAAQPSEQQLAMARGEGLELNLLPLGHDAFVFIANGRNPISSLTLQQVRDIYTGAITNWKELGGRNQAIRPFQRVENSGSQTAFLAIMGDDAALLPPETHQIAAMGDLVEVVSDYQNHSNALGYSFRYYIESMNKDINVKILKLDGIAPTKENIRNGDYPLTGNFYAVTVRGRESESTRRLLDWIVSDQGQEIVEKVGYVPMS